VPISDEEAKKAAFQSFSKNSEEYKYLVNQRKKAWWFFTLKIERS